MNFVKVQSVVTAISDNDNKARYKIHSSMLGKNVWNSLECIMPEKKLKQWGLNFVTF